MAIADIMAFRHNSKLADNEPKWGDVDKKELPRIAFADEGVENEVSTWGYPHHWVRGGKEKDDNGRFKDGTLYLHKGGLNAAWAAANGARSGKDASEAVKKHLEAHRKAIGEDSDSSDSWNKGYRIRNDVPGAMEVYIYDEIGLKDWDGGGITAKKMAKDLQNAGPSLKNISVHINSPGGRVFEAVAIYNLLKSHKAHVNVTIDGIAASAASIVAMAGNHIEMANNGILMIHKPWTFAIGNADDLRKEANMLDKVEGAITQSYLNQCAKAGKTNMEGKLTEMLEAETWMDAEEALEAGLIDSIGEALPAAASIAFDFKKFGFKNIHSALLAGNSSVSAIRAPRQPQTPVIVNNYITVGSQDQASQHEEKPSVPSPPIARTLARLKLALARERPITKHPV